MADEHGAAIDRYPLPLYLNQKYVFDVLSMMEGGFTQIETVTSRTGEQQATEKGVSGGVGFQNVFGLLSVTLGGSRTREERAEGHLEVSGQRVHTPNSLFARMRERLYEEHLVRSSFAELDLASGGFVEMTMRLDKNPLVEALETLHSVMQMAVAFEEGVVLPGSGRGQKQSRRPRSEASETLDQLSAFLEALKTGDVVDLLGSPAGDDERHRVVLTLDTAYAADPSLSDLIDGEYRVFGKVTRSIEEGSEETINLLRKTTLGRMQASLLEGLTTPLAQLDGFVLPTLETEISPPVVQVLPIAVFA